MGAKESCAHVVQIGAIYTERTGGVTDLPKGKYVHAHVTHMVVRLLDVVLPM